MDHDNPPAGAVTLVVATGGTDVRALLPPTEWAAALHTCDLVAPHVCRCGSTHSLAEDLDVLVFVGEPLGHAAVYSLRASLVTFAIVPAQAAQVSLPCPRHVVREASHWQATPAALIRHLLEGLYGEGVIGYHPDYFKSVLGSGTEWTFVQATRATAAEAAQAALAHLPASELGHCHLGVVLTTQGTLRDLSAAMETVFGAAHEDSHCLAYCVIDEGAEQCSLSLLVPNRGAADQDEEA